MGNDAPTCVVLVLLIALLLEWLAQHHHSLLRGSVVQAEQQQQQQQEEEEGEESSDAYLRNVVNELHLMNGGVLPGTEEVNLLPGHPDQPSAEQPPSDYPDQLDQQQQQQHDSRRLQEYRQYQQQQHLHYSRPRRPEHSQQQQQLELIESTIEEPQLLATADPDLRLSQQSQISQVLPVGYKKMSKCLNPSHAATGQQPPGILGFSPQELATMYKKALTYGSPVKYSSLFGAVNEQPPKILPAAAAAAAATAARPDLDYTAAANLLDRYQAPSTDSRYAYYFYPLQTFRHELNNQYGYKTLLPDSKYAGAAATYTSSKAETTTNPMNPILMGISSFLGMALFFVLSMFVYPRFLQYLHFPFVVTSRAVLQNELAHLVVFVIEAVDYYNKNLQWRQNASSSVARGR